jgi:hypothetical protein
MMRAMARVAAEVPSADVLPPWQSPVPQTPWVPAAAALLALLALVAGIATPPRAGPNCQEQCLSYPYADAVAYVPGDFIWMYPAFGMVLAFVMLIAALHQRSGSASKTTSLFGVCFAVMAGTVLAGDYFLQLVVIQASLVTGEAASVAPLSMYNSPGIFLALGDLGYLLMSGSFMFPPRRCRLAVRSSAPCAGCSCAMVRCPCSRLSCARVSIAPTCRTTTK